MPTKPKTAKPKTPPTIDVSTLKSNPRNPRQITAAALQKLCESIERDPEFMALRPIVVDHDNMVLGGNQRLRAIMTLGMKEIPARWVVNAGDLTAEQRRRFIIVDNSPEGMTGSWDTEILGTEWTMPELADLGLEALTFKHIEPPEDFKEFGTNIETEDECPRCNYRWSGKPNSDTPPDVDQPDRLPDCPPGQD